MGIHSCLHAENQPTSFVQTACFSQTLLLSLPPRPPPPPPCQPTAPPTPLPLSFFFFHNFGPVDFGSPVAMETHPSSGVGVARVSQGQVEGLFWQAAHASLGLLAAGSLKLQERTFQETPLTRPSCDTPRQANRPQTSCVKLPCAPSPSPLKPPTPSHTDTQRHSSTQKHTSARDKTTRPDRQKHAAGSRENTRSTSHVVCGDPQLVHAQWSPSVAPAQLYPP